MDAEGEDAPALEDELYKLRSIDTFVRSLDGTLGVERMLQGASRVILGLFEVDRAWFLFPCREGVEAFDIVAEEAKPEFPGARAMGIARIPSRASASSYTRQLLTANGPLVFNDEAGLPLPESSQAFGVRSEMEVVLRPKLGDPWILGVHRCASAQTFSRFEIELFAELAERVTGALSQALEARQLETEMLRHQKLESLGVLAGGIAHDFNNLLAIILGHTDLARDALTDTPTEVPGELDQIVVAAERGAELCRQLLTYAGQGASNREPVELNAMAQAVAALLNLSARGGSLELDLEAGIPWVDVDPIQLHQVLMNLVLNAHEALGPEGGTVQIRTRAEIMGAEALRRGVLGESLPEGLYVRLSVSDDGCGMSAEVQSRIFEPFFTTKFTGRGLGLAAVLGIVRGHRGCLELESAPGRGTTFTVVLPASASTAQGELPVRVRSLPGLTSCGPILLADDTPDVLEALRRVLERAGYPVITAHDGPSALQYFLSQPPRLFAAVVLDVVMPGLRGPEALAEMRRHQPDVRAVLMSGYQNRCSASEAPEPGMSRGLTVQLAKPFRKEDLLDALDRLQRPTRPADSG